MDKNFYTNLINELEKMGRPDFEIEEIGYFWNELVILKNEKMPFDNIVEEINKFQRIVIDNELTEEDEEEMFEDISRRQQKPQEFMSYLKEESYYTKEDLQAIESNIAKILDRKKSETLSELELYKFNADEYKKALDEEKEEINYVKFDYVTYLSEKIKDYEPENQEN